MPLSTLTLSNTLAWILANGTNGLANGFASAQEQSTISANLVGLSTSQINQLFAETYTISSSGTQSFDLTSCTNLVAESFTFGHVILLFITVSGTSANVNIAPGASNGLQWFFGGSSQSINVPTGASFCYSLGAAATGQTVDSTHKTMTLTNNGSGTATVQIVIVGSTT